MENISGAKVLHNFNTIKIIDDKKEFFRPSSVIGRECVPEKILSELGECVFVDHRGNGVEITHNGFKSVRCENNKISDTVTLTEPYSRTEYDMVETGRGFEERAYSQKPSMAIVEKWLSSYIPVANPKNLPIYGVRFEIHTSFVKEAKNEDKPEFFLFTEGALYPCELEVNYEERAEIALYKKTITITPAFRCSANTSIKVDGVFEEFKMNLVKVYKSVVTMYENVYGCAIHLKKEYVNGVFTKQTPFSYLYEEKILNQVETPDKIKNIFSI